MTKPTEKAKRPEKFGMFYPRGYVIVAFREEKQAEQVRRYLLDGGYDEDDAYVMDTERVLKGSSQDLEHLNPLIKTLGTESQIMESHKEGAKAGHSFLIAYAPSDLDTDRLMNVARRVGYERAQKYDRFTFSEL